MTQPRAVTALALSETVWGCHRKSGKLPVSGGDCDAFVHVWRLRARAKAGLAGHRIMAYSI
jgi:hypothetical protein